MHALDAAGSTGRQGQAGRSDGDRRILRRKRGRRGDPSESLAASHQGRGRPVAAVGTESAAHGEEEEWAASARPQHTARRPAGGCAKAARRGEHPLPAQRISFPCGRRRPCALAWSLAPSESSSPPDTRLDDSLRPGPGPHQGAAACRRRGAARACCTRVTAAVAACWRQKPGGSSCGPRCPGISLGPFQAAASGPDSLLTGYFTAIVMVWM